MKTRINFLDNLRTVMILLVVILHSAMTYMSGFDFFWIVDDPDKINALGLLTMYLDIFVMFVVFFISGYLIPISLKNRSNKAFIVSKLKRIMLPWVLAVFTLIPAYKAIFLASRGLPQEEWFTYFHLFSRASDEMWYYANSPTQNWLWFLPVLFLFQMVYLGLAKIKFFNIKLSLKSAIVLTFVFGVAYNMVVSSLELTGWYASYIIHFQRERFIPYLLIFLLGSLTYKARVFETATKNKVLYIVSNVVLTVALGLFTVLAMNLFFNMIEPERAYFFVSSFVDRTAYYAFSMLSMMSLLYVLLHTFRFNLNKTNHIMEILNRSSYQVYIVHLIVLGLIGWFLMQTGMPAIIKFIVLSLLTWILSNALVWTYNQIFRDRMVLNVAVAGTALLALMLVVPVSATKPSAQNVNSGAIAQQVNEPAVDLHTAVISNNLDAIKQHIDAGSDLNVKEPSGGSSPLITSATFDNAKAAGMLINAGAEINFQNNDGSTALHTAAFFGRTEVVKVLLEAGADKSIKNNSGSTAYGTATVPFEMVKGIYDYFKEALGPMGFELDYEKLEKARPVIAEMLTE